MPKKLLLLVNPCSGKMRAKRELLTIVQTFCDADFLVNVRITRCRHDATEFVPAYGKEYDVLVACGGDGTLNEVISGALQIGFPGNIGFIPCGTTNDLANTLGLPKSVLDCSRLIVEGKAKYMDFGAFNKNRYFTYIASFGAFTEVSYNTDQKFKNTLGHLAYIAEGIGAVDKIKPYHMVVTCDGQPYEDDFIFGAAANSLSIGGIVKLKKDMVKLTDGQHELLLVRNPRDAAHLAGLLGDLIAGKFTGENILILRGKRIQFACEESIPWCVDGEFAGDHQTVEIRNLHERLKIYRP